MNVTLAQIQIAYIVSFGLQMKDTDSFKLCGEDILLNEGKKGAAKLFAQCQQVLDQNPGVRDYAVLATQVRALRA